MIFNFLKYIRPTWYYNLRPKQDYAYFPTHEQVLQQGYGIEKDLNFKSIDSQNRDLAWRAFQQGFISQERAEGIDAWENMKLPLVLLNKTLIFYTSIIK